jgi:uncharacterized protein (TIGR02186 family)
MTRLVLIVAMLALLPLYPAAGQDPIVAPAAPPPAAQVPLVADLASHLIAITTRFAGTNVLLFGATDGPGDIVYVVKGPTQDQTIREKVRVGPFWMNRTTATFTAVPGYYAVGSSQPLESFASQLLLNRFQIGLDNIRMVSLDRDVSAEELMEARRALVRLQQQRGLFNQGLTSVNMMSNRLFRTELSFPSNVPTGTYQVEVYLFRNGQVAAAEILPLNIAQAGMTAEIQRFSRNYAPLYGILAVVLAVLAGWAAGAVFQRV